MSTQHRRSSRIAHHTSGKIAPVHASGFPCTSQFGKCSIMMILRASALALNIHVGDPFVVSHSLPHDLLHSFCITCILQVYHLVTTTLKSEFEVRRCFSNHIVLFHCFHCASTVHVCNLWGIYVMTLYAGDTVRFCPCV